MYDMKQLRTLEACPKWRTAALAKIIALKPAYVILSSGSFYVDKSGITSLRHPISEHDWARGLASTIKILRKNGVGVVVIRDIPQYAVDITTCLSRAVAHDRNPDLSCSGKQEDALNYTVTRAENQVLASSPGATLIDPTPLFCRDGRCHVLDRGIPMYRDKQHLSEAYAAVLVPWLDRHLPK